MCVHMSSCGLLGLTAHSYLGVSVNVCTHQLMWSIRAHSTQLPRGECECVYASAHVEASLDVCLT